MSTTTEKLGLIKPELSDPANIEAMNGNWDKLDQRIGEVADYVVERGIDGMWTYEKWASGKAVCWGDYFEEDVEIKDIWQDGWYYHDFLSHSYPENLFLDSTYPICQLGYDGVGQTTLCSKTPHLESAGATRLTPEARLIMITNDTIQRLRLTYYAIGRWK